MRNIAFVFSLLLLLLPLTACDDPVSPGDGEVGERWFLTPVLVSPSLTFSTIAATGHHTCAVGTDGETYCWGKNEYGELGSHVAVDDCAERSLEEFSCTSVPTPVASPLRFVSLAAAMGASRTCALTAVGEAYCWGFGRGGQLGDGSRTNRTSPFAVAGGLRFQELVSGPSGTSLTCGQTEDGSTYCWGVDSNGQLGSGNGNGAGAVPTRMGGEMRFTSFDVGEMHACGLTAEWRAYCWGSNWYGQLGVGSEGGAGGLAGSADPLPVSTDLRFRSIVTGSNQSCALTDAGTAHCWGASQSVGSAGASAATSPRAVAGGHVFVSLHAGYLHTCGLTEGGDAYCWGENYGGTLGDGTQAPRQTPTRVALDVPFASLSHRPHCGLGADGRAYCWGDNTFGQVGRPPPARIVQ